MEFSVFKKDVKVPEIIFEFVKELKVEDAQKLIDKAATLKGYGGLTTANGFSLAFRSRDANFLVSMVARCDSHGEYYFDIEWLLVVVNYESLWIKFGDFPSFEYKEMTTLKSVYLAKSKIFNRDLTAPYLDEARDERILSEVRRVFGMVDW
jgi:hypothetical protein